MVKVKISLHPPLLKKGVPAVKLERFGGSIRTTRLTTRVRRATTTVRHHGAVVPTAVWMMAFTAGHFSECVAPMVPQTNRAQALTSLITIAMSN